MIYEGQLLTYVFFRGYLFMQIKILLILIPIRLHYLKKEQISDIEDQSKKGCFLQDVC